MSSTGRPSRSGASVIVILLACLPICGWADDDEIPLDQIIVTATRAPGLVRDEPLRVEVLPADEIEENLTVQPGNLSSLLTELPGVRFQSTAAGLGGAGLQLRGMPTRHTLVLTDGLPLQGAEADSFGLLQTPPLDLARVEVIKGAASALYGGGALGGVLNLVSQTAASDSSILAGVNSRGGRDLDGFWTAEGAKGLSGTLTAGVHDQSREDVSGEGWADITGYRRYTARPRIWWNEGSDQSLFFSAGVTDEYREGGTLSGRVLPGNGFIEALHTRRLDGGLVSHWRSSDSLAVDGHLSLTSTDLDRLFGTQRIASTQTTVSAEEAMSGTFRAHAWLLGIGFRHDGLSASTAPGVGYSYNVPGVFAQDEYSPASWLKLAASGRVDSNNQYGTFFSPRLSALFQPVGSAWSLRASAGGGYAAPTPFVDEIEATGLGSLLPLRGLRAERALTESLDGKWADESWDINLSVFNSEIRNALTVRGIGEKIELLNAPGPRRAPGAELLIHYLVGPLQAIGSWSYLDATQSSLSGLRERAPLVPRQSGELGAILENKKRGRVGLELGFTGRQALEDDPYRNVSEPYFELNALGEIHWGSASIFINAINLTNVRQTRFDPLVSPSPGLGGNPITEAWAPLDGRTFNAGIRMQF